jgi:hypothetical protein
MADDRRPIGYWLKHLDSMIEGTFERTLASEGLTRRHWQVLNTLHTQPSTPACCPNPPALQVETLPRDEDCSRFWRPLQPPRTHFRRYLRGATPR